MIWKCFAVVLICVCGGAQVLGISSSVDQLQEDQYYLKQREEFAEVLLNLGKEIDYHLRIIDIEIPKGEKRRSFLFGDGKNLPYGGYQFRFYSVIFDHPLLKQYLDWRYPEGCKEELMKYNAEEFEELEDFRLPMRWNIFYDPHSAGERYLAWRYYYDQKEYSFYLYLFLNNLGLAKRGFMPSEEFVGERALKSKDSQLWWQEWNKIRPVLLKNDCSFISFFERSLFFSNYPREFQHYLLGENDKTVAPSNYGTVSFCIPEALEIYIIEDLMIRKKFCEVTLRDLFVYLLTDYSNGEDFYFWGPPSPRVRPLQYSIINLLNNTVKGDFGTPFKDRLPMVVGEIERRLESSEYAEEREAYLVGMMTAFVVVGYEFDAGSGVYQPTEKGKLLLDFVMKHPTAKNAWKVKILYDHGNHELLTDLMKKYGTQAEWGKFFAEVAAEATTME